jgi:glycosyltransferase involved in cell wall biosynthesis
MPRPISIVVPLKDEEGSLRELHAELAEVAARNDYELQVIFVDDGSRDSSWRIVQSIAREDARVTGIRFRRNFGKAAALSAGFDAAEHPVVITMDADLQDDPHEIPALLARLDAGFDVVSGWKLQRHDPWHKRWPSKVFNWLVSTLTGVQLHDHNCGLKAYRHEVLDEVRLYGELHRFIPVLAAARGFKASEVIVNHRARQFGQSKYGVTRIAKGLVDLLTVKFITGYGDRPQHFLGIIGLLSFLVGALGLGYLAVLWVGSRLLPGYEPVHLHETAALFYSLAACLVGAQFLAVGLLGEMITSFLARDVDNYSIAEYATADENPPGSAIIRPHIASPGAR